MIQIISQVNSFSKIAASFVYLLSALISLYFYHYIGALIQHEVHATFTCIQWILKEYICIFQSAELSNSIYKSNWYEVSMKNRKKLLITMLRAQKSFSIRAVFVEITLETYTDVSINNLFGFAGKFCNPINVDCKVTSLCGLF